LAELVDERISILNYAAKFRDSSMFNVKVGFGIRDEADARRKLPRLVKRLKGQKLIALAFHTAFLLYQCDAERGASQRLKAR